MRLTQNDLEYLARLMVALKTDPMMEIESTMECPECDTKIVEEWDDNHIVLTTWESYESTDIRKTLAIGCQGYHINRSYAD